MINDNLLYHHCRFEYQLACLRLLRLPLVLVNDHLDTTYDSLEKYVFGDEVVEGVAARESSSLSELGDGAAEALVTETSGEAPTEMES